MKIALLASIEQEALPTFRALALKKIGDFHLGVNTYEIPLIGHIAGVGRERIAIGLERLIAEHQITRVVNFGFAGGLDPQITVGHVLSSRLVRAETGPFLELDPAHPPAIVPDDEVPALITVDRLIDSVEAKKDLWAATGARAVDMETYHLADLCRRHDLPFSSFRAISDPADFALPPDAAKWITPRGGLNAGALLSSIVRRPTIISTLMTLGAHAKRANQMLPVVVRAAVNQIGA